MLPEQQEFAFDGRTYEPARDFARLNTQLFRVRAFIEDGQWHTLRQIADAAGGTEAAVSARLRDFRKAKHGGWEIERRYLNRGLFQYRWTGRQAI